MAACWKELEDYARGRMYWSIFWGFLAVLAGFCAYGATSGEGEEFLKYVTVGFFICLVLCASYSEQRREIKKRLDSARELENSSEEGVRVGRITVGERAAYIRPAQVFVFYQDIKWVVRKGRRTQFYMRYGEGKMKLDNKCLSQEEFEGLCKCMAAEKEIMFGNTRQNRAAYRAYKKCCDSYLIG